MYSVACHAIACWLFTMELWSTGIRFPCSTLNAAMSKQGMVACHWHHLCCETSFVVMFSFESCDGSFVHVCKTDQPIKSCQHQKTCAIMVALSKSVVVNKEDAQKNMNLHCILQLIVCMAFWYKINKISTTLCPKKVSPLNILQQPPQTCTDLNEILHTQDDIYFCHWRQIS